MIKNLLEIYKKYSERHPAINEFVKFCIVGGTNAVLDFSIYIGLTRFFIFWQAHLLGANFIAIFIASLSSFILNKYFTFRNKSKQFVRQYLKFIIVSVIYMALVQLVLYVCIELLLLYDIWAKVIASIIGLIWNFTAHKFWSFRQEKVESKPEGF